MWHEKRGVEISPEQLRRNYSVFPGRSIHFRKQAFVKKLCFHGNTQIPTFIQMKKEA